MTKILHVTPHLGGGIGKVLMGLLNNYVTNDYEHYILTLEVPIKKQFINDNDINKRIFITPSEQKIFELIQQCDIIQLEYWNYPKTLSFIKMLSKSNIPIRMVTWFHQNGFYDSIPEITKQLILNSTFLFTSECSFENKKIVKLINDNKQLKETIGYVYSSGGFNDLPLPIYMINADKTSVGYFGTINIEKQKLNNNFIEYLSKVDIPHFTVKMIGECNDNTKHVLKEQCDNLNKFHLVEFTDYIPNRNDLISTLKTINVNVHLLNPNHYGTAENTLLETMYMGIVPIVLNNVPESYLVQNNKTGFIVNSKEEFGDIVKYLYDNPFERQKIGIRASKYVRTNFSLTSTSNNLNKWYEKTMKKEKHKIDIKIE